MKLKIYFLFLFLVSNTPGFSVAPREIHTKERIAKTIAIADKNLAQKPITVTATQCPRSAGGLNDFYSEGDYWWPDPANPDGPYIQRDGETNPENFVAHRLAMIRFSEIVGSLASAYTSTNQALKCSICQSGYSAF